MLQGAFVFTREERSIGMCSWRSLLVAACGLVFVSLGVVRGADLTETETLGALRKAVNFFREQVSAQGGYVYRYSADLAKREGEGKVGPLTAWIEPPGTPFVGDGYLEAYNLAGEQFLLDAAVETAQALVRTQLYSGGWDNGIEFDPKRRKDYAYRVDKNAKGKRNTTTLDDDKTQASVRFLMHVDEVLEFKNAEIHEAALYALEHLIDVQYPNGAWPQRFSEPPDPRQFPVKKAGYPESWSRTFPRKKYTSYYTFNDDTIADTIKTFFEAAEIYGEDRYASAACKGGDFILLAQMPEPQPAWAQQYDADMHPAWARKFEPPAVTGGESQGVLRILMEVYRHTGDRKYLEPIPRAVSYLKKSVRPDGKLARFYELETNTPLYFTKDYRLTYSDSDMPTHYGFIVSSKVDAIASAYEKLLRVDPKELQKKSTPKTVRMSSSLKMQAEEVIKTLDSRGAWVERGSLRYHGADDTTSQVIETRTFVGNILTLARFLAASKTQRR